MEFEEIKVYYFNDLKDKVRIRMLHANAQDEWAILGPAQGKLFTIQGRKNSLPFIKNWGNIVLISFMENKNVEK